MRDLLNWDDDHKTEVVSMIKTSHNTGQGTSDDPVRKVICFFRGNGELVFKVDTYSGKTISHWERLTTRKGF